MQGALTRSAPPAPRRPAVRRPRSSARSQRRSRSRSPAARSDAGLAAQAAALGTRLADLAPSDAKALAAARAALAASTGGGDERRDFQLGQVLDLASAIPLEIAEACADVAALAAQLAETGEDDSRPDAAVAAILAAAAAQAAVRLVEVNLAVGADDARVTRARAAARLGRGCCAAPDPS